MPLMYHLRRDLIVNLVLSVVGAGLMMLALREAARLLPAVALGLLLLSRRIADLLANVVQVGTPHAVRRYLPLTTDRAEQRRWLTSAALPMGTATLILLGLAPVGRRWLTPLLFGDEVTTSEILFATALLATTLAVTNLAMSALIAIGRVVSMNVLQILSTSGVLIASVWILGADAAPENLLFFQAAGGLLLVVGAFAALYLHFGSEAASARRPLGSYVQEMLAYGAPRTLSPFAEILLLVIGPWLLRDSPAAAGALILALTLLRLVTALVQPLALVGGVASARLLAEQNEAGLARGINMVVGVSCSAGILLSAAAYPWLPLGLRLWLGPTELAATVEHFMFTLLVALTPYALFQGLKPILETLWRTPWMLYIMVANLALFFLAYGVAHQFFDQQRSVMIALPIAIAASGIGTVAPVRSLLRPSAYFGWIQIVAVSVLVFIVNFASVHTIASLPSAAQLLFGAATLTVSLAAAILLLVSVWPSPAVREAARFLMPGLFREPPTAASDGL